MTNEKYNLTNDQSEIFKTTVEVNSIANDVALGQPQRRGLQGRT